MRWKRFGVGLAIVAVTVVALATSASAELVTELGILDLNANGGINPATGSAWQAGDTYRLTFVTSGTHDALSDNMATYDAFVQGAADAAGLGGTWKAIGSTIGVNSRTRLGMGGAGVGVLRLDSVIVANDYNDFWNGSLDNAIGIDENGAPRTGDVWGGCLTSGAPEATRHLGSVIIDGQGGFRAHHGRATGTGGDWIRVFHKLTSASLPFYAMSDPLTVTDPTLPDIISVNVYGYGALPEAGRDTVTLEPGESAGLGDWNTTAWRNISMPWDPGAPQAPQTITSPQGSTATFTLNDVRNGSPYYWSQTRDSSTFSDGNATLLDGHGNGTWDPGDGSKTFDMVVSDIPYDEYDVIVYLGVNDGQKGNGQGRIIFNGVPMDFTAITTEPDGTLVEIMDSTTPGNYIVFEGVTGSSFTAQVYGTGQIGNLPGFVHLGVAGFQIRPAAADVIPEPATLSLLGLGALLALRRRRRQS